MSSTPRSLRSEPYFPQGVAGVLTTKCECGWEVVSIMPEEADVLFGLLFHHMQAAHGLKLPIFTCEQL